MSPDVNRRSSLCEARSFLGFLIVIGPFVFVTFGATGFVTWAILGEWIVRYDDQYDWLDGCLAAGRASGGVGVLASVAWCFGIRTRAAGAIDESGDDSAKPS